MTTAAAPFDPSTIAGLTGWWKADALSLNDGDAVASIPDSSGGGRPLVQATGAAQPVFKKNIRGSLPVWRNANGKVVKAATTSVVGHIFVVASYTNSATFSNFPGLVSGSGTLMLAGDNGTTQFFSTGYSTFFKDGVSMAVTASGAGPMLTFNVLSASTASPVTTAFQVGQDRTSDSWVGDICEVLTYSAALSTSDRQSVEAYLKGKWGTP